LKENVKGDDTLEGIVNPLSDIATRLESIEKRESELRQQTQDNEAIARMVKDTEKRMGIKIDRTSEEFQEILKYVANENPIYMAMTTKQAKGQVKVPTNLNPAVDIETPEENGYTAKELESFKIVAKKAGMSLKEYFRFK
jgi:hypothetical protein